MISENLNKKFIIFKSIYLLPIFLITGPFLPDLMVSLSVIFFLYYFYKYENSYFKNKFFIYFSIFYVFLIFSTFLSTNFLVSLKSTLPYFRFFIFCLVVFFLIENKIIFVETFHKIIFLILCVLFIDSIYQFFNGENILNQKSPIHYRVTSFFGDEAILGSYTLKILVLFLFLNNLVKYRFKNFIFYLSIIIAAQTIIISGDRTPLVLLIIYLFFLLLMDLKKVAPLLIILIIGLTFTLMSSDTLKQRFIYMSFQGFYQILGNFDSDSFYKEKNLNYISKDKIKFFISHDHTAHIVAALKIFDDHKIKGSGPNTFRNLCYDPKNNYRVEKNSCSSHPHNFYIQLLSETGIIIPLFFLLIFMFVLFKIFISLFKKNGKITNDYLVLLHLFLLLLPLSPNGNFFNNWLNIINFLPFGFYLSYYKNYFISKKYIL